MLEEPFWLGLIAIGSVIILISFAYCLKKMFAEKIEQFFTEEIEKAKYMRKLLKHHLFLHLSPSFFLFH